MMLLQLLDYSLLLNEEIIALTLFPLFYLLYYFGSDFKVVKKLRLRFGESPTNFEKSVYLRRTMGFVLLGLFPFLVAVFYFERPLSDYGLGFPSGNYALLWSLIPLALVLIVSILRPSRKIDTDYYPEVRKDNWNLKRMIINSLFWFIYLLGYEFAIRGFVFFTTLHAFGIWPAIVINSALYSFIHIFKGKNEAFGAFFLGILFCLMTYFTNSIWMAFIIHVLMAVMNDIKAGNATQKKKLL